MTRLPRIAIVVGNPKPRSRTLTAALYVGDMLADATGLTDRVVVDLATVGAALLDPSYTSDNLIREVTRSHLLLAVSPTYKATYTGLLKLFFDRLSDAALHGTVAIPMMTAGSVAHAMAAEVHLRPLLVELGASVPVRSVFVTESQFADPRSALEQWAHGAVPSLRRALST